MNEERAEKIIQNKTCVQNKRKHTKEKSEHNGFFFVIFFFRFFLTKKPTIYVERLHKKRKNNQL
jgi:hypothetical protein